MLQCVEVFTASSRRNQRKILHGTHLRRIVGHSEYVRAHTFSRLKQMLAYQIGNYRGVDLFQTAAGKDQ